MTRPSISDVPSFLRWIDSLDGPMMFRGQSAANPLLPSIARIPNIEDIIATYENWQVLQLDIIERFAKYARPFMQQAPADHEEWLVHAQHFGAPTRLLDWSTNPLKALFWAVENADQDSTSGIVWAFSPKHWRDDALAPTPLDYDSLTPYFPKQLNPRIVAQEGCFVAFPLPANRQMLQPLDGRNAYSKCIEQLVAVTIPGKAKRRLRIELRILGVTHRFVFGDFAGVGATIRAELRK